MLQSSRKSRRDVVSYQYTYLSNPMALMLRVDRNTVNAMHALPMRHASNLIIASYSTDKSLNKLDFSASSIITHFSNVPLTRIRRLSTEGSKLNTNQFGERPKVVHDSVERERSCHGTHEEVRQGQVRYEQIPATIYIHGTVSNTLKDFIRLCSQLTNFAVNILFPRESDFFIFQLILKHKLIC